MVKVGDTVKLINVNRYAELKGFYEGEEVEVYGVDKSNGDITVLSKDGGLSKLFTKDGYEFVASSDERLNGSLGGLVKLTEQWSINKGLDQAEPTKQFLKVSEEFGEIGAALARGNEADFKDAVGDTVVTLIILAQQKGYTLKECLQVAYDEIAGRTGQMVDGVFVKDEDLEGEEE